MYNPQCLMNYLKDDTMCNYLDIGGLDLPDCRVYAWGVLPEKNKMLMDVD